MCPLRKGSGGFHGTVRSICLTCVLCKLLDRVVFSMNIKFLQKNNLHSVKSDWALVMSGVPLSNVLVRRQVECGSTVWSPYTKENIQLKRLKEGQPDGYQMITRHTAVLRKWWATSVGGLSKIDVMTCALRCFIKLFTAYLPYWFHHILGVLRYTRHMHQLAYRQTQYSLSYQYSFFPMLVVPADLVLNPDLDSCFRSTMYLRK